MPLGQFHAAKFGNVGGMHPPKETPAVASCPVLGVSANLRISRKIRARSPCQSRLFPVQIFTSCRGERGKPSCFLRPRFQIRRPN